MNQAVAINVRFARQAHHTALWASGMAKRFPEARRLYGVIAKSSHANARAFIKAARKLAS